MTQYMLASGYYDIDDVSLYGPFESYEAAMAAVPADAPEDTEWRALPVNPVAQITVDHAADGGDDESSASAAAPDLDAQLAALTFLHGGLEGIPAPNDTVFQVAARHLKPVRFFFPEGHEGDWAYADQWEAEHRAQLPRSPLAGLLDRALAPQLARTRAQAKQTWATWAPLYAKHQPQQEA